MEPLPCFEEFIFQPKKITLGEDQLRGVFVKTDTIFHGDDENGYAPAGDVEVLPAGDYEIDECDAAHSWLNGNGKRYWVQNHSLDALRGALS